jgi:hypothetical protein
LFCEGAGASSSYYSVVVALAAIFMLRSTLLARGAGIARLVRLLSTLLLFLFCVVAASGGGDSVVNFALYQAL